MSRKPHPPVQTPQEYSALQLTWLILYSLYILYTLSVQIKLTFSKGVRFSKGGAKKFEKTS